MDVLTGLAGHMREVKATLTAGASDFEDYVFLLIVDFQNDVAKLIRLFDSSNMLTLTIFNKMDFHFRPAET